MPPQHDRSALGPRPDGQPDTQRPVATGRAGAAPGARRIAVITAPNMRFVNTGMTTVELAAKAAFRRLAPDAALTFYSIVPPNPEGDRRWMMMDLGQVHRSAREIEAHFRHRPLFEHGAQAFASDLIVYWGDFLQARHYVEDEAAGRLRALYGLSAEQARSFAYHALLQSDAAPETRHKTVVFGSSLLYNRVADYVAGEYGQALRRLLRTSKLSAFRDPLSAQRAAHLSGDYATNHLGIDPAFLLEPGDLHELPAGDWAAALQPRSSIGLFFGARTALPDWLFPLCEALASNLGSRLEWLPWFPYHEILRERPRPRRSLFSRRKGVDLLDRIERLLPRGDDYSQGDLLRALRKYRVVITDTYHLCINAWRAGTPAVCFGSAADPGNQVIRDFKKRVLYEMYDAGDYYLDVSALSTRSASEATARRLSGLLQDDSQAALVRARISAHTQAVRQRLQSAVGELAAH